jgi:hypothetical protein
MVVRSYREVLSSERLEGRSLLCQGTGKEHVEEEKVESALAIVMGAVQEIAQPQSRRIES